MSNDTISLKVEARELLGKKIKQLREQNIVPAVIHNHGESVHIQAPFIGLTKTWHAAGKHHPVELDLGGTTHLTIIKEVDFEPVKHTIRHVTFGAIRQNETVDTEVPIRIEGDPPAEKAGLIIIRSLDTIEIKAFPRNLPDEIVISADKLVEIGDKIVVGDLKLPEGVELQDPELVTVPIAVVEEPRALAAEEAEEEAAAEGAEGGEAAEGSEAANESSDNPEAKKD